ncbi:MAG: HEAT repeat domain-containing protein [Candidatus Bathyarchaeia archaeon]
MLEGLNEPDDLIRARTAHALERISRTNQELIRRLMPQLISLSMNDRIPMVRWHLAMIFGNTASTVEDNKPAISALLRLLKDESVIVRSWAISSLCIIGRREKRRRRRIIDAIGTLQHDKSVAIRARTAEALKVLRNENVPLPAGWSKASCQRGH